MSVSIVISAFPSRLPHFLNARHIARNYFSIIAFLCSVAVRNKMPQVDYLGGGLHPLQQQIYLPEE